MGIFDNNYDFNKYKFFYAVATSKSFSKAAEVMHVSQPAISYAVKELEEQLNVKLFIRSKNGISLTEEGEKLVAYVKKSFDILMVAHDVLEEEKEDLSGAVRIGIYSHISLFMMPGAINDFKKKYPKAKFFIYSTSNEEMIPKLKNKELDLLIMQYPIFFNENSFNEEVLCDLETCFFTNKEYYDIYCNNKDMGDIPVILPVKGYPDIDKLKEKLKEKNITIKHEITSYATELNKELAKEGLGISWGLKKSVKEYLDRKLLYELPVDFDLPSTKFSMVYNENYLNKTTREFIKFLKENIDKYTKL